MDYREIVARAQSLRANVLEAAGGKLSQDVLTAILAVELLRGGALGGVGAPLFEGSSTSFSLPDLVKEIGLEHLTDIALLVAFEHLTHDELDENFNVDDIKAGFARARVALPANTNDTVNKLASRKLVSEALEKRDGKKTWVISPQGEQLVEKWLARLQEDKEEQQQ